MKLREKAVKGTIINAVALFVVFFITSAPTQNAYAQREVASCIDRESLRYSRLLNEVRRRQSIALTNAERDYIREAQRIENEVTDPDERQEQLNDLYEEYQREIPQIQEDYNDEYNEVLDEQREAIDNCTPPDEPSDSNNNSQPQDNQDGSEGGGGDYDPTQPYRDRYNLPIEPIGKVTMYPVGNGSGGGSGTTNCEEDDEGTVTCEQDAG